MVPRIPNTLCHPLAARRVTERISSQMSTRRSAGCRGRAGRLKRTVCSALPRLSALLSRNVGPTGTAFRESESGRSVRCERAGGRATTTAADGASLGRCGARIPLAWPAAPWAPLDAYIVSLQLAAGRWRGRGPQGPSRPFGKPPCPQPHRTSSGCGWDKREPALWPSWRPSARSEPIRPLYSGQKEGFLSDVRARVS